MTFEQRVISRLDSLQMWMIQIYLKEIEMAQLGQDIIDAVTAETTSVDGVIALINGLVANQTVTPEQGAAILSAIKSSKDKLDAALAANTVPPTP